MANDTWLDSNNPGWDKLRKELEESYAFHHLPDYQKEKVFEHVARSRGLFAKHLWQSSPTGRLQVSHPPLQNIRSQSDSVIEILLEAFKRVAEAHQLRKETALMNINGTPEEAEDRAARLRDQADRLLEYADQERKKQLLLARRFGEDNYPDGTIIRFGKTFPGGHFEYKYAAIKTVNGDQELWYTTGPKSPKGYSWEELTTWMGIGVTHIERAVAWRDAN